MPQLLPFRGLRPDPGVVGPLDDFVCPPYDVISEAQRLELLQRSPYNVVRVELPAGEYGKASALLSLWSSTGALLREGSPALYGYRMTSPADSGSHTPDHRGRRRPCARASGPRDPASRTHDAQSQDGPSRTDPRHPCQHVSDLVPVLRTGPDQGVGAPHLAPGAIAGATDDDGNYHELWPIVDPGAHAAVAKVIGAGPLLVADGHHRYETALTYQAEQAPGTEGPGAVLALVVELAEEHLQVMAIHRLVSGLPAGADVLGAFRAEFEVTPAASRDEHLLGDMSAAGAIGIVTPSGSFLARPRAGTASSALELDSSRVDTALGSLPSHDLVYEHDVDRAIGAVRAGRADAAVFCRPAAVSQIAATARGGDRMPPKTTFSGPSRAPGWSCATGQALSARTAG